MAIWYTKLGYGAPSGVLPGRQMMGVFAESLVDFLCGSSPPEPPPSSLAVAADGFTDCVAVMIAGAGEPVTRHLLAHVASIGGRPVSRLLLGRRRATVAQATLVGTAAAHALDFDDYAFSNHVSALMVPAILAESERSEVSGRRMLEAYVAGYEAWGAVMKREPDHLHSKGWHPTGVFGAIGVAAAIGRLRGLDAGRMRHALGLAAASGGGVMDNFGTQAKPFQGARAAEAGIVAVELALAGVDAGSHAIDGDGGLLAALSPAGRVDRDSAADWLGHQWLSAHGGINIKRHPTVGASQRAIDAALQLRTDHSPAIDQISRVIARVSEKHAAVMRFHRPANALEAKFSLEFGVAAALVAGRVGLAELSDEFVARDDIQRLMRRVSVETGPDDDPDYPVGAKSDTVAVELTDGARLESEPVRRFRGHGDNPLTREELAQKFMECAAPALGESLAARLFETLQALGDAPNVRAIPELPL